MNHPTPSAEIFNEMKNAATKIWNTYDNQFGYVDEKMETVNRMENYADNAMVFYRMFDYVNQQKMRDQLSDEAIIYIDNNL